jgi:hypothetical protein
MDTSGKIRVNIYGKFTHLQRIKMKFKSVTRGTPIRPYRIYRYWVLSLLMIVACLLVNAPAQAGPQLDATQPPPADGGSQPVVVNEEAATHKIYIPGVRRSVPNFLMLGVYVPGYTGYQDVVDSQLKSLDAWTGKQQSIVGLFVDFKDGNPGYNIPTQLESLYQNGYTAFINLQAANTTMAQVAQGAIDSYIRNTAQAYATWVKKGGNRMAFIAPFTEMNGEWTTYGGDPANFKIGYRHVRDIFLQAGAPASTMRWVFGPNGWSNTPFEDYYPGDDVVDINAFSSYNYGYCNAIDPWQDWKSPDTVYGEYIQRMKVLSPTKPIFIAQTATTSLDNGGSDMTAKNQWLADALNYLAADRSIRAFIYVNLSLECDWPIYTSSGVHYDGYPEGAKNSLIVYKSPAELAKEPFVITP